jgi:hypothetical protein
VLYKAHRFEELPLLPLFSAPRSALDLDEIIRQRRMLVINTRMSRYGPEMSSFVGSLMINVLLRQLARQGEGHREDRAPVMMVIDEFQTYVGVPWQELLAQMRKYGGRVIIGTQSLASLRQQDENLPGVIMSGAHSLFAFLMNGEDADYLTRYELGRQKGGPGPETLTNLEPYRVYARMVRQGGTLTHPFYFRVAAPPEYDADLAEEIWRARAGYSMPYQLALQDARRMLNYLDRYAVTPMSTGGGHQTRWAPKDKGGNDGLRAALLGKDGIQSTTGVSVNEDVPFGQPSSPGSVAAGEEPLTDVEELLKWGPESGYEDLFEEFEQLFAGDSANDPPEDSIDDQGS